MATLHRVPYLMDGGSGSDSTIRDRSPLGGEFIDLGRGKLASGNPLLEKNVQGAIGTSLGFEKSSHETRTDQRKATDRLGPTCTHRKQVHTMPIHPVPNQTNPLLVDKFHSAGLSM